MLSGHQCPQIRQVREQFRQVGQGKLALAVEVLVSADGVVQIREDALLHLCLNGAAHQQQAGPGEAGRDQ